MDKEKILLKELNLEQIVQDLGYGGKDKIACPFHRERTPSLSFKFKRGFWHCFGCGRGGDLVDFYQEYLKLKNKEEVSRDNTLDIIARRYNIDLKDYNDRIMDYKISRLLEVKKPRVNKRLRLKKKRFKNNDEIVRHLIYLQKGDVMHDNISLKVGKKAISLDELVKSMEI